MLQKCCVFCGAAPWGAVPPDPTWVEVPPGTVAPLSSQAASLLPRRSDGQDLSDVDGSWKQTNRQKRNHLTGFWRVLDGRRPKPALWALWWVLFPLKLFSFPLVASLVGIFCWTPGGFCTWLVVLLA